MSTTPSTNSTVCAVSSPVFVSPSSSDNFHPGDEVKVTWAVASNYSTSFGCSLSLRSLRLPLSVPILNNASVPTYPSTLTYNNTQISYTDPGVPCGSRSVTITWKIPADYDVPSDPNFIVTAYSYGTVNGGNFSDSFNSDVFRIVSPISVPTTNTTASDTPASPSGGLQQGAIIGIAVGAAVAVMLIGIISWFVWRRKRNNSNHHHHHNNNKPDRPDKSNKPSKCDKPNKPARSFSWKKAAKKIPILIEPIPSTKNSNSSATELDAASKIESSYTGTRSEAGGNELFELPGSPPMPASAIPAAPKVYYELGNGDEAWEMAGDIPQGWDNSSLHSQQQRHHIGTPPPRHMSVSPALVSPMTEEPGSPNAFHVAQCVNRQSVRPSASRRTSKARIVSVRRSMTFASVSEVSHPRSPGMASEKSGMRSPRYQV